MNVKLKKKAAKVCVVDDIVDEMCEWDQIGIFYLDTCVLLRLIENESVEWTRRKKSEKGIAQRKIILC